MESLQIKVILGLTTFFVPENKAVSLECRSSESSLTFSSKVIAEVCTSTIFNKLSMVSLMQKKERTTTVLPERKKKKKEFLEFNSYSWCGKSDSNTSRICMFGKAREARSHCTCNLVRKH